MNFMLIEFSFGNFRSFKDLTTLSMVAAHIRSADEALDKKENVYAIDAKLKLLKSKALYGANASGKSNLVKALHTFLQIIRHSVKNEEIIPLLVEPFKLNSDWLDHPTFFQLIVKDIQEQVTYRYGFEIKAHKILSEWLFVKKGRENVPYLLREGMSVTVHSAFKEAKKYEQLAQKADSEIFRNNSLFLTAVAALGGTFAKNVINALCDFTLISGLKDPHGKEILQKMLQEKDMKEKILDLLKAADLDIENIELIHNQKDITVIEDSLPEELKLLLQKGNFRQIPKFITEKAILNAKGVKTDTYSDDLENWESEGTKEFLYRAPFLIKTLSSGNTLVIDEFDARLHPNLTKKIVKVFNSNRTNPKGAQLIFVTHDSNLLRDGGLRRDQICFVDKDAFKSSFIRTLVEFKGVRPDTSVEKPYLNGEYGGIPALNRFNHPFEN
jgi:uncharacterized protein